MRKSLMLISIILIAILSLGLISCAPQADEDGEEGQVFYYEDQPYSFAYQEGVADCRMELDGEGHCAIYKKYSYEKPLDESKTISTTFFFSDKCLYLLYSDNGISFNGEYVFTKSGKLEKVTNTTLDERYTYGEARDTGLTFSMSYSSEIEGMQGVTTLSIKPIKYQSGEAIIALGYKLEVPEFAKASGEYTIKDGRYVKLNFAYNSDYPTVGLYNYQILPETTVGYGTRLIEESSGRKNGHVEITVSNANKKYVQLKDDGTFYFVIASTTSNEEDLFTQDSYYGKSFTTKMTALSNGEGYSYEYRLTFDQNGVATYECTKCSMSKNYKVNDEGELSLLYYDIEEYNKLIGTHMDFGTSNNISFANNYIVYVDYNYSRYTFEGDTSITIYRFDDYVYAKLRNDKGVTIAAKFYDNGEFDWLVGEFIGVDLADHSDEF